jgi:hypothetical protein
MFVKGFFYFREMLNEGEGKSLGEGRRVLQYTLKKD